MINLFLKDYALLQQPQGLQWRNLQEAFPEVPQDYEPTRAVPIDYTQPILEVWQAITDLNSKLDNSIELYSSYNTAHGIIPEPYISYFSSIFAKTFNEDYVSYVSTESSGNYTTTVYNMFVGDISYGSNRFTGSGTLYKYYTSSRWNTYRFSQDSNFSVSYTGGAMFTSLPGTPFPDFTVSALSSRYVLYCLFFFFLIFSFDIMFHVKRIFRR